MLKFVFHLSNTLTSIVHGVTCRLITVLGSDSSTAGVEFLSSTSKFGAEDLPLLAPRELFGIVTEASRTLRGGRKFFATCSMLSMMRRCGREKFCERGSCRGESHIEMRPVNAVVNYFRDNINCCFTGLM